jgi:hypothetical protein
VDVKLGLTLLEERRLRVFESRAMRKIWVYRTGKYRVIEMMDLVLRCSNFCEKRDE